MKQEASMGRRPITRADEGEVRRRVAPRGYTVAVDNGEDGHVWIAGFWGDGPDRETRAALAPVGIFPGPDGWEIEDSPAVKVGDLFRSKQSGKTWTVGRYLVTDALWEIRCSDGGMIYEPERDLLDRARRDSNKALRDEAARRKAQARGETANEKAQRHHAERSARFYNDRDGRRCLYAQGTAADLAALEAAIDRSVDRRYRSTGPTGRREGRDRYAFDALTALAADEARAQTLAAQHAVARANAEAALPAALPGGAQDEAVPATYR